MNVVTIDGLQEVGVKRENEDIYRSRRKKAEAAEASTSRKNSSGTSIVKDPSSGMSVDISGFAPVNKLRDNIESMYAVEVLKGDMGQTTLKQTHVYISVKPEVQADQFGKTKERVVRSVNPGEGDCPPAIKNTFSILNDIKQTLEFVDNTNKETLDRNLEREKLLDDQNTSIEQRRIVGESLAQQMEYFVDQCKFLGLGTSTPAEVLARMILTGGIKF